MKYHPTIKKTVLLFIIFSLLGGVCVPGITGITVDQKQSSHTNDVQIHLLIGSFDPLKEQPPLSEIFQRTEPMSYSLIQCIGPIQSEWVTQLQETGLIIVGYLPDYTYITSMNEETKTIVETFSFVRWIGPYYPAYKIDPQIQQKQGSLDMNVVLFSGIKNTNKLHEVTNYVKKLGGVITYEGGDNAILQVRIDASQIQNIAKIPDVAWIDLATTPVPCMDNVRNYTGATDAQHQGFTGTGIVGEVKDNGFDPDHPDFTGHLIGIDGNPPDESHGTCTFGTVFSSGLNSEKAKGMVPGAQGVFCSWSLSRTSSMNNLMNNWNGLFQSNSWHMNGDTHGNYNSYSRENDNCISTHDNMSMLYAAGNSFDGVYDRSISGDSSAKNVICVGAVNHYDDSDRTNDEWVNAGAGMTPAQGPAADRRIKPDLCGPFDNGYVTDSVDGDGQDGYTTGNYFPYFGGTSFATPVVAGAVGLIYNLYQQNVFGNNPTGELPHASTVKALLIADAYQYDLSSQATRYQQGWGTPDINNTLTIGTNHVIINEDTVLQTGKSKKILIEPTGESPLKISLVWTDPAATIGAEKALVNDLDLKVTAPNGRIYKGNNGLTEAQWSSEGGSADELNNVENVFIQNPQPGEWTIEVFASNIALDGHTETAEMDQDFALVASGCTSLGDAPSRVVILGLGRYLKNETDSQRSIEPLLLLVVGNTMGPHLLGPSASAINLDEARFIGLFLPINGFITPIIGVADEDGLHS